MEEKRKPRGEPMLTDVELVDELITISALSKALAKDVLKRKTKNRKGGGKSGKKRP